MRHRVSCTEQQTSNSIEIAGVINSNIGCVSQIGAIMSLMTLVLCHQYSSLGIIIPSWRNQDQAKLLGLLILKQATCTADPSNMTQTSDSSSDPQGYFGALLYESDGDFFVELDSLLQSVGDFDAKKNPEATSWDSDVGTSLLTATRSVLDAPTGVTRDPSPTSCLGSSSAEEVRSSVVTSKHKLAPTSTSVPMRAEERKKNQNRSRKRQREEIEHLRASADELQIQLEGLLTGSSDKPIHLSHKQMQTYLHETLAWKRTAASEQQQAEQGVKKNLQLRALIDENKVICKSLHDTCTKSRVSSVSVRYPQRLEM